MSSKTILLLSLFLFTCLQATNAQPSQVDEARARRLINALGCKGCHQLDGDGGTLAPPLDQVGSRRTKEEIVSYLAAHASMRKTSIMPSFSTTDREELENLSEFLYQHR
jgi:mono/diheme cytochrome c family protein